MINAESLPVLDAIAKTVKRNALPRMNKVVFVCVQHLLHTTVNLLESLIALGADPNNIFLLGKQYSSCDLVAEKLINMGIHLQEMTPLNRLGEYTDVFNYDVSKMWQNAKSYILKNDLDAIIVLDDGGRCLEFIRPDILSILPVIGIEQTTAGLFNPAVLNLPVPFVDVAACAVKVHLESNMVVDALFSKLNGVLPQENSNLVCGVIGVGVIGKAVVRKLVSLGYNVIAYDSNESAVRSLQNVQQALSIKELLLKADYIFGCTGRDITASLKIEDTVKTNKVFFSCTSEDKEFLSLLKYIQSIRNENSFINPLADIVWKLPNGATITVVKGGFPINFDNSGESVIAENIQLTRGLLLGALVQAFIIRTQLIINGIRGRVMLHPFIQRFIVSEWISTDVDHEFSQELIEMFGDINWITANSGGVFCESNFLQNCFNRSEISNYIAELVS